MPNAAEDTVSAQSSEKSTIAVHRTNSPSVAVIDSVLSRMQPTGVKGIRAGRHQAPTEPPNKRKGFIYIILLALQCGFQAILTQELITPDANKKILVLACELVKVALAAATLMYNGQMAAAMATWDFYGSLVASAVPALIYAIQNVLTQMAYQQTDPLIFNLVNQSKILWTAFFVFVFLRRLQSRLQMVALVMLAASSLLLSNPESDQTTSSTRKSSTTTLGLICVVSASVTSGLASALSQKTLQLHARNSMVFSIELGLYGSFAMMTSLIPNPEEVYGLFGSGLRGWTSYTMIPICTNAIGGILVGQVTKHAGGVAKGYSIIIGIVITCLVELLLYNKKLSSNVWIAVVLVVVSTYVYSAYPYRAVSTTSSKNAKGAARKQTQ